MMNAAAFQNSFRMSGSSPSGDPARPRNTLSAVLESAQLDKTTMLRGPWKARVQDSRCLPYG
jgi:hypothetical protein